MTLRQSTRDILARVEDVSGFPVRVLEDPQLSTLASMRMARGSLSAHVVTYRPSTGEPPDYVIAFQCGFILRYFAGPLDERCDLIGTHRGSSDVRKLISEPGGAADRYHLDPAGFRQLQSQLLDGLLTHLRSVPVGLRVAEWIRREHPDFAQLQRSWVLKELAQNRETLGRDFKLMTPERIFRATQAVNAAFALFWAQVYNESDLLAGYRTGPDANEGEALLTIWNEISSDPLHDRELVDAWGGRLKLSDWYEWIPYQSLA